MSTLQLFKFTLLHGKCTLVGHKISESELKEFKLKQTSTMYTYCLRCRIPLEVINRNNRIMARSRY